MITIGIEKALGTVKEATTEILELLTRGGCQKFLILTEVEIILKGLEDLKKSLK